MLFVILRHRLNLAVKEKTQNNILNRDNENDNNSDSSSVIYIYTFPCINHCLNLCFNISVMTATVEKQNLEQKHLIRYAEDNSGNVFTILIYQYLLFKSIHL